MGVGESTPTSLYANANLFVNSSKSAFETSLDDQAFSIKFTSPLFHKTKSQIMKPYEYPSDDLIVDIIISPTKYTMFDNSNEAVERVILPLLKGSDDSKPIIHQLLLQFFAFLKDRSKIYLKKLEKYQEVSLENDIIMKREIHKAHHWYSFDFNSPSQTLSIVKSFSEIFKLIPPSLNPNLVFQPIYEQQCLEMSRNMKDGKSVMISVLFSLFTGNISLLIQSLMCSFNLKKEKIDFKYSSIFESLLEIPFDSVSFFPKQKLEPMYSKIAEYAIKNETMCSNGKYLFIAEDVGFISIYFNGIRKSQNKISKKNLFITCSNGFLYATDYENEYLFQQYPFIKIAENLYNTGSLFHSKHKISFPCSTDGKYIFSLSKNKKINVFSLNPEIVFHRSIELSIGEMVLKDPYHNELIPKNSGIYTNGVFITFIIIISCSNHHQKFSYFVRNFSAYSGEHMGDRTFSLNYPISTFCYDVSNNCFYGLSQTQTSINILRFPYFGPKSMDLNGLDSISSPKISLETIVFKFQKCKTTEEIFITTYQLINYMVVHMCGVSFKEYTYGTFYDSKFVRFFSPDTLFFNETIIKAIKFFMKEKKNKIVLSLLGLLQINISNSDLTNPHIEEYLELFKTILNNTGFNVQHRTVCFIIVSCFKKLFDNRIHQIPLFFEKILKQDNNFIIYATRMIKESGLLPYCFSFEKCKNYFSKIFAKIVQNSYITFIELEIIDNYQYCLVQTFTDIFLSEKGMIPKKKILIQNLFILYSTIIVPKYIEYIKDSDIINDDFTLIIRKFMFLIQPNLKYTIIAHSIIKDFYILLLHVFKKIKGKPMIDNDNFTFYYSVLFEVLNIFVQCNASILKGGKEVHNCSDFLWIRQPLVDAKMSADAFDSTSCTIFDHKITEEFNKLINLTDETLLRFLKDSIKDLNPDALDKLYENYPNILTKHLSQKEKQLERILFILFTKYYGYQKEIKEFLEDNVPNDQTREIMKNIYKIRSKRREILQQIKSISQAQEETFFEDLIQKAIYLLLMDFKSIKPTDILKNVNAFLFSKHMMQEIYDMISAADRARSAIQDGIEYTEKMINSDLQTTITTFVFDYMFVHKVIDRYVRYIDSKSAPKTITFVTKEFISNEFLIFYFKYLVSLVKSKSPLLQSQILKILKIIREKELPSSFTILVLFIIQYYSLTEIDRVAEIVFFDKNKFDVPLIRMAVKSKIPISFDIWNITERIRIDNLVTHSYFELLYEMLENTHEKIKVYLYIIKSIANICIGKFKKYSKNKNIDEIYSICEEYIQLCRRSLCDEIFINLLESILIKPDSADNLVNNEKGKSTGFTIQNRHKPKYLAAVFSILSDSYDYKHINSLVKCSTSNLNYYLSSVECSGKYHVWSLPITAKTSAHIIDEVDLIPISQYPFLLELYPHYQNIIPYIVKTLNNQTASPHIFYIYQSFKLYLTDPRFLKDFVSYNQNLKLNSFSFWNTASSFFKTIMSCPIVKSSDFDFTLCSDEKDNIKIGKYFIESTSDFHFLFSQTIFEESKLVIDVENGSINVGIHSLSLYPFNLHICGFEKNSIYFNEFPILKTDCEPNVIIYDPHEFVISFMKDKQVLHQMEVPPSSYTFFIIIKGQTKLNYRIKVLENCSESDDDIGEDAKEFLTCENSISIIEYPKEVLEAIGTSLNTSLTTDKVPTFQSCDVQKLSSLRPFGIFNPKIRNSITSKTQEFLLKELYISMKTELMTQTFLNSLNNVGNALELFRLSRQRLVEIMTSLLHLIEPLNFDTSIVDFSYNVFAKKPITFEFRCIENIISYFEPNKLIKHWLKILKIQFSQVDFHFAKVSSITTLVYNLQSFGESRVVSVQDSNAFLVFRLGFGINSNPIATCGTDILTSNNILYIKGNSFQIQKSELATDETIIVIPIFQNPNLSLFNSFVELAVTFKYFILYLAEQTGEIDSFTLKEIKHTVYRLFIDAFDSESPFFYTYSNAVLQFLKTQIPLCSNDLDADMAKPLSLFALYSKHDSFISHFLNEIRIIWDEKALLPLKSYFPQFLTEEDLHQLESLDKSQIKWEIPSSKFPEFIDKTSDKQSIMNVVLQLLKPRNTIKGFPFQFLLHFWAKFTSQFPPFEKKIINHNKFAIKFIYYHPTEYEFVFKSQTPPKFTIKDETLDGYDIIIESNSNNIEKEKFVIFSKTPVDTSQFIFDHRERFSSDIMALFVKWDLNDDEKLIKFCNIEDLMAPSLPLTISVQRLISYNLPHFPSVLSIRYLLLKILNWLFFSEKVEIPNEYKILYDSLSFPMRMKMFRQIIEQRSNNLSIELTISRKLAFDVRNGLSNSVEQTIVGQISKYYKDPKYFRRLGEKPWVVSFENERGVDGGGPARELVTEAAVDMMSPQCGIFSDTKAHFFVPIGRVTDPNIYRFVGALLGIIVRNALIQDFRFPYFFWKYLCGKDTISIDDIYSFDSSYKDHIENLMNIDEENFDPEMTFVETDFHGNQIQLKPGKVTYETRDEFILLSNQFRISEVLTNMQYIKDGFYENIDVKPPYYITPRLLEFSVCGTKKISYKKLIKMIKFDGVKYAQRKIFLDVLKEFDYEDRSKLLKFVTGRVRLPMVITSEFLFTVDYLYGENNGLPKASSCFLQFHLPEYSSLEIAQKMIKIAIEFSGTFENK
ncbi:hypothetical protein TRFO_24941 [Tritrichomonas foetus]|uniref:HECT domain-containing protein n=1 Tax=Tritrichomonas foetus TaxID=1144522 RepID=A0A1J4KBR2_9EUKA|nr:hypothetical protein TRFO_24941 [Tritrichomonas foetus]|eukprot:OHT06909.1 hypothetical protein TRFO_24941 [Tritrichomonas foetus]